MSEAAGEHVALLKQWLEEWGVSLPGEQTAALVRLGEDVAAEAERWAVSGVAGTEENLRRNILDSLLALSAPEWAGEGEAVDVGSGGGFPGLALALAEPDRRWWLLEATRKKAAFLAREASALGVGGRVHVVWGRAEDRRTWRPLDHDAVWPGRFARVTARAVAPLRRLVPWVAALPERPGGLFFAYKGPGAEQELQEARASLRRERLELVRVVEARLPRGGEIRRLLVFRAEG
ncbi:MAG: 16S rRNA (guanine(527)-N(7))-methyltransferase RsmG [Bacillota bacterium]|nr:16S rRNA (guanine(527)-N(7))-methyltransferase RsmG [Bacillota bacterium]